MTERFPPIEDGMSGTRRYTVQIDDLPDEVVAAHGEREFEAVLREILERETVARVGDDVHVTVTRPDGSSATSTFAEMREALRQDAAGRSMPSAAGREASTSGRR